MTVDYYKILGVSRGASEKEVRQAYRRLARQYHPDVNRGDKNAEERFKSINQAYEVLSDSGKRGNYDQFGENWKYAEKMNQQGWTPGTEANFFTSHASRSMPFDFDLDDLLSGMFGTRRSGYGAKRAVIEQGIEVTLDESFRGAVRQIKLMTGHGRERRLEVKIPPGVDSDSRIHISDDDLELYLVVRMVPHQRFKRDGDDIKTDVGVDLLDAVLGGEVELLTLSGKVVLRIPPETQNGRVFRLAGRGMPILGNSKVNGNLYATVRVKMPGALNDEEKRLFEKLRDVRVTQDAKHE